jgi:hypothetical protein
MKAIDLARTSPSLSEILELAGEDNIILRTAEGRQFVLAEIDDFADEIERVRRNDSLMQLLRERSREKTRVPLEAALERLQGPRNKRRKGDGRRKPGS